MVTERQKKAVQKMVENGGKISPAMKAAGYSDAYAKNPKKFVNTRKFKEILREEISDETVVTAHSGLITKKAVYTVEIGGRKHVKTVMKIGKLLAGNDDSFWYYSIGKGDSKKWILSYIAPSGHDVARALDMIYKINGEYAAEESIVKHKLSDELTEDLMGRAQELIQKEKDGTNKRRARREKDDNRGVTQKSK